MLPPPSMSQYKYRSYTGGNTSSALENKSRKTRDTPYYGQPGEDDAHQHNDGDVVMGDGANMVTKNGAKLINTSGVVCRVKVNMPYSLPNIHQVQEYPNLAGEVK